MNRLQAALRDIVLTVAASFGFMTMDSRDWTPLSVFGEGSFSGGAICQI
jgi:hypothetical protein